MMKVLGKNVKERIQEGCLHFLKNIQSPEGNCFLSAPSSVGSL